MTKLNKNQKDMERLASMFNRMQESGEDQANKISSIQQEFKNFVKENLGNEGLQALETNLKPVSCQVPKNFSADMLEEISKTNIPEFDRLKQCGYIFNFTLFMFLIAAMSPEPDMSLRKFKTTIKESIESDAFKEVLKTPISYYGY